MSRENQLHAQAGGQFFPVNDTITNGVYQFDVGEYTEIMYDHDTYGGDDLKWAMQSASVTLSEIWLILSQHLVWF